MRRFICFFFCITATFAQEAVILNDGELAANSSLQIEPGYISQTDVLVTLSLQSHTSLDVSVYGGLLVIFPNVGLSIRGQNKVHGLELDCKTMFNGYGRLSRVICYLANLSYLYHFNGKRSGFYLGGGPGVAFDSYYFVGNIASWFGYQFASDSSQKVQLYGFVDAGATFIITRSHLQPLPLLRAGAGFSF
jgi:hypothetical protein